MAANDNLSGSDDSSLLASINITPFVDVVLVLLVIFMVTTPILMKDLLNIRLPQTQSSDGPQITTLGVVISKTGQILLNGNVITELQLIEEIKKAIKENKDTQAIISADIELSYGKVVKTIDLIKSAGLEKFALQIEKMVDEKPNSDVGNQK